MGDGEASLGLGLEIGDLEEDRRVDDRISEDKSLREDILIELQRTRERERERLGFVDSGCSIICTAIVAKMGIFVFFFFFLYVFFLCHFLLPF
jgi:hypothetical protein